jgi:hypothetical protein
MIHTNRDGSIVLIDDTDPARAQTLPAGTSAADRDASIAAFMPPPAPERRLVRKSTIVDRLQTAGLLQIARAALDAADLYTRERWNARDAIYADDETAIALLTAVGADVVSILAPDA